MSLKFIAADTKPHQLISIRYTVNHYGDKTVLEEPLTLSLSSDSKQWIAEMHIKDCNAPTPDEALTRMAYWLRRLAEGIEQRQKSIVLPLE